MGLVIGIIVLVVIVVLVLWTVSAYNALVRSRNGYTNAWSQIDVQLQRRFDLIPNLVETAKGYMAHERDTLEAVTQARANAISALGAAQSNPGDPAAMQQLGATQGALTGALGRFTAVAEAYPDLKASQVMIQLQEELASTENKVAFSRQAFNDAVMNYENRRQSFPASVLAGMFHFQPKAPLGDRPRPRTCATRPRCSSEPVATAGRHQLLRTAAGRAQHHRASGGALRPGHRPDGRSARCRHLVRLPQPRGRPDRADDRGLDHHARHHRRRHRLAHGRAPRRGAALATSLGAVAIDPTTQDPQLRRL